MFPFAPTHGSVENSVRPSRPEVAQLAGQGRGDIAALLGDQGGELAEDRLGDTPGLVDVEVGIGIGDGCDQLVHGADPGGVGVVGPHWLGEEAHIGR